MRYGDYYGHGMSWGLSPGAWVLLILFWAAIVSLIAVGLVFAIRALGRPAAAHGPSAHGPAASGPPAHVHADPPPPYAQQILDERLARGEIEIDEYRLRRDELRGVSQPPEAPPETPPAAPPTTT